VTALRIGTSVIERGSKVLAICTMSGKLTGAEYAGWLERFAL